MPSEPWASGWRIAVKPERGRADDLSMRRLLSLFAAVLVLMGGLAVVEVVAAPTASAACASPAKSLSGTVEGQDGRYLSAMVGIELVDSAGRKLKMDGCVMTAAGYSTTVSTNTKSSCCYRLPGTGWTQPTYDGVALSKAWQVTGLPSNAVKAWIEVYPKRCCVPAGTTNTDDSRYGRAMRRPVPVSSSSIDIDLPLRCGLSGNGVNGSTGRIIGRVYDNGKVVASRVGAWTTDSDSEARIMGWGLDPDATGAYAVEALAPGGYSIIATASGISKQLFGVTVRPCQDTVIDVAVRGSLPPTTERPVVGDWDGDGDDEPGTFSGGTWRLRDGSAVGEGGVRTFTFGVAAGDLPVVGDWDGDGVDDIGVYRKGTWYLRSFETATSFPAFAYGQEPGDVPTSGDWDGDGRDDAGIFRRGGVWYLRSSVTGSTIQKVGFGREAGDVPVPGDWDGDGDSEPGIFRGGTWHLRTSSSTAASTRPTFSYGVTAGDRPVVGDWDGDGDGAPGIYRRGEWHLRGGILSSSGTVATFYFR